ncbi:MAG: hypothetical protein NTZ05_10595 [Chloroflexi bacterium]|nr:hypothetical protein [Chloroflexota bacterium]
MLADQDIERLIKHSKLGVYPFTPSAFQPASLDVHLGKKFLYPTSSRCTEVDPLNIPTDLFSTFTPDWVWIQPNEFLLATTLEHISIPVTHVATLEGKSTLGRLGLLVHVSAGHIKLTTGMPIGQLTFSKLDNQPLNPYGAVGLGSHYQTQEGPTGPKSLRGQLG